MKNHLNIAFLIVLLLLVGFLVYEIFAPFLVAIFLAFIFSQLFRDWYEKILSRVKQRKSLASLLTCLLIILIIIIPLTIISFLLIGEISQIYQNLQKNSFNLPLDSLIQHPLLQRYGIDLQSLVDNGQFSGAIKSITNFFLQALVKTYEGAIQLVFMLFTLYYLFKDGDAIVDRILELSPLKNIQEKILFERFTAVSKATLKGTLVIAVIQGILQGFLFWFTGVPSPAFWGLITVFFALIPMLGATIVWLPAGLIMLFTASAWQGVTILLFGFLVVSTVDNFLRPYLVGNQLSLHPLMVFFSTIGGIALFGFTGILLGPIIVVLFITLLGMYREEFRQELDRFNQ